MRRYIDLVTKYVTESILAELIPVATENVSKEIGSGGSAVDATMNDMLPHHGVFERNKPQAYSEIFAKATGDAHNDSFAAETPPGHASMERRRNNDAGIGKLKSVSKDGDASAILHSDFAGGHPQTKSVVPRVKGLRYWQ